MAAVENFTLTRGFDYATNIVRIPIRLNWSWFPIYILVTQAIAILTNGSLAFLLLRDRSLLTPFTIYIINLTISNVVTSLLYGSARMVEALYVSARILDKWYCVFLNYSGEVTSVFQAYAHVCITFNRLWAVTFPRAYRLYNTKRFAVGICLAMWVAAHVILLPPIFLDLFVKPPVIKLTNCVDYYRSYLPMGWYVAKIWTLYDVPMIILAVMLPVLCYKVKKQSHFRNRITAGNNDQNRQRQTRGLLGVVLMTISVIILYTPSKLYYTLKYHLNNGVPWPSAFEFAFSLYFAAPVLDPMWFITTMRDLRKAFQRTFVPFSSSLKINVNTVTPQAAAQQPRSSDTASSGRR